MTVPGKAPFFVMSAFLKKMGFSSTGGVIGVIGWAMVGSRDGLTEGDWL